MIRILTSCVLSFCFLISFAGSANAGLECLSKTYGKAKTITANYTQTLIHKDSGNEEVRSGKFFIKRPNLVRWVTQKPAKELLIVNNEAVWNYLEDEEVVYKYPKDLANESQNALLFLLGDRTVDSDFYVEDGDEKGTYMLFPKEPKADLTEATIWLDETACTIKRLRIVDFYGNVNDLTFSDVQFDTTVKDSLFSFTPPAGVDVEDNTKK